LISDFILISIFIHFNLVQIDMQQFIFFLSENDSFLSLSGNNSIFLILGIGFFVFILADQIISLVEKLGILYLNVFMTLVLIRMTLSGNLLP